VKVAILGGGVGAVAAAYALTDPGNPRSAELDVTLYQIGWRLGGKGASGRNLDADRRIQEHGVHVWFGFYYNARAMMRRCYAELAAATGQPDGYDEAFKPHDGSVLEDYADGKWEHFPLHFPRGLGFDAPTPRDFLRKMLERVHEELRAHAPLHQAPVGPAIGLRDRARAILDRLHSAVHETPIHVLESLIRLVGHVGNSVVLAAERSRIIQAFDALRAWICHEIGGLVQHDTIARRLWMFVDLGFAIARGMIEDDVLEKGFDVIDDYDLWEWLHRHGADGRHEDCVLVRTLYSQAFAFVGGDPEHRQVAAGSTLRALFRMLFAYEEAFMWKMQAGMGDIVFAPFYQVLKSRGVKFAFFHRVKSLHLSDDGERIARIEIGRQLRLAGSDPEAEYEPLVGVADPRVGIRMCWPSAPLLDQIEPAQAAAYRALAAEPDAHVNLESAWSSWGPDREDALTLRDGVDFDAVVLGISMGALKEIGHDLERKPEWKAMVDNIKTVRTQAFQLWLRKDLAELGWPNGVDTPGPVVTAYEEPLDTYADMTQTLPAEGWNGGATAPRHIAYFCGVMADDQYEPPWYTSPSFAIERTARVFATMQSYLQRLIGHLWPEAVDVQGRFDWRLLVGSGIDETGRLRTQFWVANIDPTERYVLSVPGTTRYRLRPDRPGIANLVLAGDWTLNAINMGCVEAAVTSGMKASFGLTGYPALIIGETDF